MNEFNIDRMSHISQLRTLCTSVPDRWIELERKRWDRIIRAKGRKVAFALHRFGGRWQNLI